MAPECGQLELDQPIVSIEDDDAELRDPDLAFLSGPARRLGVFLSREQLAPQTGKLLHVTAFDAWSAWPPAVPAAVLLASDGTPVPGVAFAAVAHHDEDAPESAAVVFGEFAGIWFDDSYAAATDGTLKVTFDHSAMADRVVSLRQAQDAWSHWVVYERTEDATRHLIMVSVGGMSFFAVGCATTPVALDAASDADGWLVATALGADPIWDSADLGCTIKYPTVGPAQTLYFGRVDFGGYPLVVGDVIGEDTPVARIRMARASYGAWVAWGTATTPLRIARIDASGKVVLAPSSIPALLGTAQAASIALEHVGDDAVVAIAESDDTSSVIVLYRVEPGGSITWTSTLPIDGAVDGPISMTGSDGKGLLLSWAELPQRASRHLLRVARVECLGR